MICIDGRQVGVREDSTSASVETVELRPGYHFYWKIWDAMYVDDPMPLEGVGPPLQDPEELDRLWEDHPNARSLGGPVSGSVLRRFHKRDPLMQFEANADFFARGTQFRLRRKIVAIESPKAWRSHRDPVVARILAERIYDVPWSKDEICR
jgi:hypothetical protein